MLKRSNRIMTPALIAAAGGESEIILTIGP